MPPMTPRYWRGKTSGLWPAERLECWNAHGTQLAGEVVVHAEVAMAVAVVVAVAVAVRGSSHILCS